MLRVLVRVKIVAVVLLCVMALFVEGNLFYESALAADEWRSNVHSVTIGPSSRFQLHAEDLAEGSLSGPVRWSVKRETPPADGKLSLFNEHTGLLTAGGEGESLTITATLGGRSVSWQVKVQKVAVSSVKFKKTTLQIAVNDSYDLSTQLLITPSNAENTQVTWASDNEAVATVNASGMVFVRGPGSAKITATSVENPAKSAKCTIKGKAVSVRSVSLSASNVTGDAGDSYSVVSTVKPSNASLPNLLWASDNESVASVDQSGKISMRAPGKAVITATTQEGKSAKLNVRVRGGGMVTIKLSAVGDVVLGGDKRRLKGIDTKYDGVSSYTRFKTLYSQYGQSYFFRNVSNIFHNDDITLINLEGTITNARLKKATKSFHFQADPAYTQILPEAGVDIVTLANNHTMDFNKRGYNDTKRNLRNAGVKYSGFGSSETTVMTINNVRIGFAGFRTPASKGDIKRAIRKLKNNQKCQIVVVSFHWTFSKEWRSTVSGRERSTARYAVRSGADLVLGHHKHVVSGIERYKGKMIAYDIGNFVTMIRNVTGKKNNYTDKDSMIYQQRFNVFEDGYVEVAAPNIIPCVNSDTPITLTGNPRTVSGSDATRILDKIRARTLSADKELVTTISGY